MARHSGPVEKLAFDQNGSKLFSQSSDRTVRCWNVDPEQSSSVLRGHSSYVYPVRFSPNGKLLASGSWDNSIRIWNLETGKRRASSLIHLEFKIWTSRRTVLDWYLDVEMTTNCASGMSSHCNWLTLKRTGSLHLRVAFHPKGNRIAVVTQHHQAAVLTAILRCDRLVFQWVL